MQLLKTMKSYMMPIAMTVGILLHEWMDILGFLTPYLIAMMLFFTYCNMSLKDIRFSRLHFILLGIQLMGSVAVYFILLPFNSILAQGAMICVLAPTATSAPVITNMLGGNIASLTAYSLLCNMTIVVLAPTLFAFVGEVESFSFIQAFWIVFQKVSVLLFLPFLAAMLFRNIFPTFQEKLKRIKGISFYLWTIALMIVSGRTVQFILNQESSDYTIEILMAVVALFVCIVQFLVGRRLGRMFDDTIAGGQGLGQKNTILTIWMAQTYLNPLSSIAPGAYVLWQNVVNSYQVWRKRKEF